MAHRERRPPSPRASLRTASDDELVAGDSTRPLSSSPTAPDDAVAPGPNAETLALMVVPVAIGSYGTAVQLVGRLDYRGVMLLNCCTCKYPTRPSFHLPHRHPQQPLACLCQHLGLALAHLRTARFRCALSCAVELTAFATDPIPCRVDIVATLGIQALRIWLGQQDGQPPRVPRRATWVLGGQLGCIVAVATALQTMGLQRTTASRAGFLVQLSSVFVPLGEAVIYRRPPPRRLLAAMAMSLIGTALLVFDTHAAFGPLTSTPAPSGHTDKASAGAATSDSGDALVVLAAALYSAHILALGQSAAEHQPLELATSKSLIQLLASVAGWSAASIVGGDNSRVDAAGDTAGNGVAGFGNTLLTPRGGLLVLWTGLVTCAYPMWAQTFGKHAWWHYTHRCFAVVLRLFPPG